MADNDSFDDRGTALGTAQVAQVLEDAPVDEPTREETEALTDEESATTVSATRDDADGDAETDTVTVIGRNGEVQTLPLLPLRGTVVFPLTVVPLAAAQPRSLRLIDDVMSGGWSAFVKSVISLQAD